MEIIRNRLILLISFIFLFSSFFLQAATINITIRGDNITYENAISEVGDGIFTLTSSEIYNGLTPTKKWVAGLTTVSNEITLLGPKPVNVNFNLQGLKYEPTDKFKKFSTNSKFGLDGRLCSNENQQGTLYDSPSNSSCIGKTAIAIESGDVGFTPFFFIKPMFSFTDLKDSFVSNEVPTGTYYANTNVQFRYYYYTKDDIFTYRNLTMPISIQINYISEYLSSIEIPSSINIPAIYTDKGVEGKVAFSVIAKGFFNSGIKMEFKDRQYHLTHKADLDSKIPYYIECEGCNESVIIDKDGNMHERVSSNSGVVIVPIKGNNHEITFKLKFGYAKKTINEVKTGIYSDARLIIVFGVDL